MKLRTAVLFALIAMITCIGDLSAKEGGFAKVKFEEVDSGLPYKVPEVPVTDPKSMAGIKVALVCAHGFEEIEATYPLRFLRSRGATVDIITPDWIKGRVMAVQFLKPSLWVPVSKSISEVKPTDYCTVLIPGGAWNPIIMRSDGQILNFVKGAYKANKLIASVCHGPQVLISAGLVKGKEVTGVADIRQDLRNAGARVVEDQSVVIDGNILTSRDPNDLKDFCQAIEQYLRKNLKFCKTQEKFLDEPQEDVQAIDVPDNSCPKCFGSGNITGGAGMKPRKCSACAGTGQNTSSSYPSGAIGFGASKNMEKSGDIPKNNCSQCLGSGKITGGTDPRPRNCPKCNGTGTNVKRNYPPGN